MKDDVKPKIKMYHILMSGRYIYINNFTLNIVKLVLS